MKHERKCLHEISLNFIGNNMIVPVRKTEPNQNEQKFQIAKQNFHYVLYNSKMQAELCNANAIQSGNISHVINRQHTQLEKRNARERKRVQQVNSEFQKLRKLIVQSSMLVMPANDLSKRISKVKILNVAINYIRHLQDILASNVVDANRTIPLSPASYTSYCTNSSELLNSNHSDWSVSDHAEPVHEQCMINTHVHNDENAHANHYHQWHLYGTEQEPSYNYSPYDYTYYQNSCQSQMVWQN
jgi:hypothetical protein